MNNQKKLLKLLDQSGVSQKEAAERIAEQTMRPCSLRSVQAWLADSGKPSARPCPEWAVLALETRLRILKKIV